MMVRGGRAATPHALQVQTGSLNQDLSLDHTRLSFYNIGIKRRLTDVHGHAIEPILT